MLSAYLCINVKIDTLAIMIRDITDSKKNQPTPDVGSIIAYALASAEYDEKKSTKGYNFWA